jgi:hypothetical protein
MLNKKNKYPDQVEKLELRSQLIYETAAALKKKL